MKFVLREYQGIAVEAVFGAWKRDVQRPAIVLATGLGKTVIFAEVASRVVRELGGRPVILTHRDELCKQAARKLRATDPGLSVGIVKAGQHEINADIVVASVQTLVRRLGKSRQPVAQNRFTHVIVDECHHAAAQSYMDILRFFGCMDGDAVALGVTATLARADGVGLGGVWQSVEFEMGTLEGIEQKWLAIPHAERVVLDDLDLSKVKSLAGDWSVEELGSKMFRSGAKIAQVLLDKGRAPDGRLLRSITFAPTVACAFEWANDYREAGIRTEVVYGETDLGVREQTYGKLDRQEIDAIINCMVLTEGFDLESIETVVIGRPTKSRPLYIQMIGRGLRVCERIGKRTCLILDVVGTINDKLTTLIDLSLPSTCECACDCELEHLCRLGCNCPRDRKGKLKRPCLICARTWKGQHRDDRERCPHYVAGHVGGCRHRCEGLGRPGPHDPDEEIIVLDPDDPDPEEIIWDDGEIVTKRVDLFEKQKARAWIAPKPKPKLKAWRTTQSGRPYLPAQSNFEFWVFLHQDADGSWSVGEKPSKGGGQAKRLASGLTFKEAVIEAEDSHPTGGKLGRPLAGLPSEAQLGVLQRSGVEIPSGCTRQQASDLLSDLFASRAIG